MLHKTTTASGTKTGFVGSCTCGWTTDPAGAPRAKVREAMKAHKETAELEPELATEQPAAEQADTTTTEQEPTVTAAATAAKPTQDYASKIRALLAKAEDPAATPAEAETYSAKAEALMVKWGISDAMLEAAGDKAKTERIVERKLDLDSFDGRTMVDLAYAVGRGLGTVRVLYRAGRNGRATIYLIGFASDCDRVKLLFESLSLQALSARAAWWKTYDLRHGLSQSHARTARRQFVASFAQTVEARLAATRSSAEDNVSASTALVLVDRKTLVEDEVARMYPKLGTGRGLAGSMHGAAEGRAAGRSANLGGTQVTTGKAGALA